MAIPFPSGLTYYPFIVAQQRGYFQKEGLSMAALDPVSGSGATLQALTAGKVTVALPGPGQLMQAVATGISLDSVYTLYQRKVFAIVVPANSKVRSIAGLKGAKLGIKNATAGATSFAEGILSNAGLKEGTDYTTVNVGNGGTAIAALDNGSVAAYAGSFADIAIMKERGAKLLDITPAGYEYFMDSSVVLPASVVSKNPHFVIGLGRALAEGTVWGMNHPSAVVQMDEKYFPSEDTNKQFALAVFAATIARYQMPPNLKGKWGMSSAATTKRVMKFFMASGLLKKPINLNTVFVNKFVPQYNHFDVKVG